ncbi:MAG: M48 family metalloprotease [Desulfobacterales bacterium]|nr:M48 family metalloprotease [Desulfobacterales bacterium]
MQIYRFLKLSVLLLVLLGMAGCVSGYNPVTGESRFYGYSWEKERAIGSKTDKEITAQFGVYPDKSLQNYIQNVSQAVLQESDLRSPEAPAKFRKTPFTFRVLDSPVVNAFALPGGYIYVTRGLLAHLQNEAQLAVVLGHEIAHVAARHASRRAFQARLGQIGLLAGSIIGSQVLDSPELTRHALNLSDTAMHFLFLKYSRDDERQADRLGIKYAAKAGYQAGEASGFFQTLDRLSEQRGQPLPSWQSTHPDPGQREENVPELVANLSSTIEMTKLGPEAYLSHIDKLVVGEDPREGYVAHGVFYHPEMRFKFSIPADWTVQNQKTMVALGSPQGDAAITFQLAQADTARQAARQFSSSQGIQVKDAEPTVVNGHQAYAITAVAKTQQGVVGLRQYFIEHKDQVFAFAGFTMLPNYEHMRAAFEQTLRSFATLSDPKKINVSPLRLNIITVDHTAEFRTFIASPPGDMSAEDIALLNQTKLGATVEAGRKLKIPVR